MILDPIGSTPPTCNNGTLTALTAAQNLTLTNVAVLAPNGAVYARRWHLPCNGPCPAFTLEGSIAAKHLGLYGIPDPSSGDVTHGWSKTFTYPTDDPTDDLATTDTINEAFWRARPPWWPGFTSSEWAPKDAARSSTAAARSPEPPTPEPLTPSLTVAPESLNVNEDGSNTFTVRLAIAPSDDVTVTVESDDTSKATVMPATLTFTTGDWATNQPVTVTGVPDLDTDNETVTVTLIAPGGSYNGATATVAVTVTDEPSSSFDAGDATAYVDARDELVTYLAGFAQYLYGQNSYSINYLDEAERMRLKHGLDPAIPLGDNPNSLPSPATTQGQQDLRNAIDALAVAAGLPQEMIDAAES